MGPSEMILLATGLLGAVCIAACLRVIALDVARAVELEELKAACARLQEEYHRRLERSRAQASSQDPVAAKIDPAPANDERAADAEPAQTRSSANSASMAA